MPFRWIGSTTAFGEKAIDRMRQGADPLLRRHMPELDALPDGVATSGRAASERGSDRQRLVFHLETHEDESARQRGQRWPKTVRRRRYKAEA